jgi:threonylcarbamoyladenosine tRNA methylthiotransferase MtaB
MTSSSPLRVAFTTLGCKVNQSESDTLARQFAAAGHQCVPFEERADVYVVNTCTVTHVADKKSRQMLSQARRSNPEALVVATGCYASIVGDALAGDGTMVIRNRDKDRLVQLVEGRLQHVAPDAPYFSDLEKYLDIPGGQDRTRAMVKAQDGCDSHCTYCIIPRARGRSRSVPVDDVVRRVRALVQEGHAEVVITGVDLGSYGEDRPDLPDLGGLLEHLLTSTDVLRIRVSSLEPGDFDPSWLRLWRNSRLCRHLHVPLQSGSAGVLERMERRYTPRQFAEMVALCRDRIPGVTVTTDVMVGFPGESEAEFDEGFHFIQEIGFDGMHVFKYSPRSGTRAARMPEAVSNEVKAERSHLLREEALAGLTRLRERHVGTAACVAWESETDGVCRGLTDTNVRVYGPAESAARARISRVRLTESYGDGLWSEPARAEIPLIPIG